MHKGCNKKVMREVMAALLEVYSQSVWKHGGLHIYHDLSTRVCLVLSQELSHELVQFQVFRNIVKCLMTMCSSSDAFEETYRIDGQWSRPFSSESTAGVELVTLPGSSWRSLRTLGRVEFNFWRSWPLRQKKCRHFQQKSNHLLRW